MTDYPVVTKTYKGHLLEIYEIVDELEFGTPDPQYWALIDGEVAETTTESIPYCLWKAKTYVNKYLIKEDCEETTKLEVYKIVAVSLETGDIIDLGVASIHELNQTYDLTKETKTMNNQQLTPKEAMKLMDKLKAKITSDPELNAHDQEKLQEIYNQYLSRKLETN